MLSRLLKRRQAMLICIKNETVEVNFGAFLGFSAA